MKWLFKEKTIGARIQTEGRIEIVFHFVDDDVAYTDGMTNCGAAQAFEFLVASDDSLSHSCNVGRYIKAKIAVT